MGTMHTKWATSTNNIDMVMYNVYCLQTVCRKLNKQIKLWKK